MKITIIIEDTDKQQAMNVLQSVTAALSLLSNNKKEVKKETKAVVPVTQ